MEESRFHIQKPHAHGDTNADLLGLLHLKADEQRPWNQSQDKVGGGRVRCSHNHVNMDMCNYRRGGETYLLRKYCISLSSRNEANS